MSPKKMDKFAPIEYISQVMKFGYARVSNKNENLRPQTDALHEYGVDVIYTEKISGSSSKPILKKLINMMGSGDTIVITKLDRLSLRLYEFSDFVTDLQSKNITLVSIHEKLDTSTDIGKFAFEILRSIIEMESNVISEYTTSNLASAKAEGRVGGRRSGLSKESDKKAELAAKLYLSRHETQNTISDILKIVGISSKTTLYKYLRIKGIEIDNN